MRTLPYIVSGSLAALILAGCADSPPPQRGVSTCGLIQVPADWALSPLPQEDSTYIAEVYPAALRPIAQSVLYADTIDLNCDGVRDVVAQVIGAQGGPEAGQLMLVGYLHLGGQWERVLAAPSLVAGREVVVAAAPLSHNHGLDLITLGIDEGGYTPQVFRWDGATYQNVPLPQAYFIRLEEEWSRDCRKRIVPRVLGSGAMVLLRETISRAAAAGHGTECLLPSDTLRIAGDSLIRLENSK